MRMHSIYLAPLLLALVACKTTPTVTIDQRAQQLVDRAAKIEPTVTPALVSLAEGLGGEMYKIEHRLKTLKSTKRKLDKEHLEDPSIPIAEMELDDTLRYTMRFEDEPAGHYVESVRKVLQALESQGHTVVRLKNYWPQDDNYSGVNGVMKHPSGMEWELQFHTAMSLKVQKDTRAWYEELRKVDTPLERKRELFDLMTDAWSKVPVPKDVLEPNSLHANEEIRDRDRP